MIFDPLYLLVIGIGFGLSLYASTITKGRFRKYSQYTTRSRMTGADIARSILEDNNIRDAHAGKEFPANSAIITTPEPKFSD